MDILLLLIITIASSLIFINSFQVFEHFHNVSNESIAKKNSRLAHILSKKALGIFVIVVVSVIFAITLILAIKDMANSDSGFLVKSIFFISLLVIIFLSIIKTDFKIVTNNVHANIEPYVQTITSSAFTAILFSIVMGFLSYHLMDVDLNMSYEEYLNVNMPKPDDNNFFYIVESISTFKSAYIQFMFKIIGEEVARFIFSFIFFLQSLFIYYYVLVITNTIVNIKNNTIGWNNLAFIPISLTMLIFYITPDYKKEANTIVSLPMQGKRELEETQSQLKQQAEQIKILQSKLDEKEIELNKNLKDFDEYKKSMDDIKFNIPYKCLIFDCTIKDFTKID